ESEENSGLLIVAVVVVAICVSFCSLKNLQDEKLKIINIRNTPLNLLSRGETASAILFRKPDFMNRLYMKICGLLAINH
nr:hypothetical protein [Chitinophagales bacterium]